LLLLLPVLQGGDSNLRLSYVQYAIYYLLTCGGFDGSQGVAAAADAFRAVPDGNGKYAAAGVVDLRRQLLEVRSHYVCVWHSGVHAGRGGGQQS
jgi:hypothetical protein